MDLAGKIWKDGSFSVSAIDYSKFFRRAGGGFR